MSPTFFPLFSDEFRPLNYAYRIEHLPLPTPVSDVIRRLTSKGAKVRVYGGFLRDYICLGDNERSSDVDACMELHAFLAMKDPEDDVRRDFVLHEPHLLYMMHLVYDGTFKAIPRPFVLCLKEEVQENWGLKHPVGLSVFHMQPSLGELLAENDLGFCAIASDGVNMFCAPEFQEDYFRRSMTMIRCKDARDYARTLMRIVRFQGSGYADWQARIPRRFQEDFEVEALPLLSEKGVSPPKALYFE